MSSASVSPARRPPRQPNVGVALGSGSARGLAHIGVLRAIEEAGLKVAAVAGTSMGAFIGAIYASGKLANLEARFREFDWKNILSLLDPVFPKSGLIDGQKIADFARAHLPATAIEQLPIPFCALATDIMKGAEVALASGDLIEAVRASIAVPGIFTPVRNNGSVLVDGGLVNPVPVSAARAMGTDFVIAVDLNHDIVTTRLAHPPPLANESPYVETMARLVDSLKSFPSPALAQFSAWLHKEPLPGIFDVLLASIYIMQANITQANLQRNAPDILIQPPLGAVRFMEFDRAPEIIEIGYRSALEKLAEWRDRAAATLPDRAEY